MRTVSEHPVISCPICQFACFPRMEKDTYRIVQCSNCDFLFVNPMPTSQVIAAYYASTYRGAHANFYPKDRSRRWRAFWRSLAFIPYLYNRDVVDLGCGGGHMLAALCRFARSGTGVDLSHNSIAFAKRHFPNQTFFAEDILSFSKRKRCFDFVFSSELLEHLRSPDDFMTTLRAITRPNALVYLSAPDAGHRATPSDLATWPDICPPEHLQWFNETNLAMLFDQNGFVPFKRYRTKTPAHSVFFRRVF
ncbi:methyltransferase type 11 [Acetobacter pasteurianus NBRC 3280]|uniref:Methyltransferase type 11 n=1 Tax=Acetobacter pasteurianus NBRC 3278 TaxID=1226660 RepID=A0A401X865_ACEPA|nr:class I SAM-dependent methyltransferase [Acetobacter pasteurianus]GCD60545.1 methyltransferase type 11 [Acetobacter pasteurianus NBRC 3277]GCD64101.1 methyltransferase type 11 [Acetobacter pasteurianus NBRC 3278]GCD70521.1 methyltransferase type 11 [Acetobacter pasteurianus NBRC 3280]